MQLTVLYEPWCCFIYLLLWFCVVPRVLLDHDVPAKNINLVSLLMADSGRSVFRIRLMYNNKIQIQPVAKNAASSLNLEKNKDPDLTWIIGRVRIRLMDPD